MDIGKYDMPGPEPTRDLNDLARRAAEVFDRRVKPKLRSEDDGKFVALDIHTGDHEIHGDDYTAVTRLRERNPSAEVWLERIGQPTAYQMRRGQ